MNSKNNRVLVVNVTAAQTSGALIILKQLLDAVQVESGWSYIFFISPNIQLECAKPNVSLVPIDNVKSFYRRFMWDLFGLKKWLKVNGVVPSASLSFQNTNFHTGYTIPNYVYLHQSIPFFKRRWSPFKSSERILWFYKNVYPFFIGLLINKKTQFFVQLEYIKNSVNKTFKVPKERIHVIVPKFKPALNQAQLPMKLDDDKINLFYPAASFFYKNHNVLLKALEISEKRSTFVTYLTVNELDFFGKESSDDVICMGSISFEMVLAMYNSADALVFPSYVESYGLPLLEAASCGMPIIVADLPYSREVLQGYQGVTFAKYDDPKAWSEAIAKLEKGVRYEKFKPMNDNSWNEMFKIINSY